MKDIRDRYTAEEFGEDNMVTSERSMRSSQYLEDDTIEQTVFDYIYGDKSIDLDVLLWADTQVFINKVFIIINAQQRCLSHEKKFIIRVLESQIIYI